MSQDIQLNFARQVINVKSATIKHSISVCTFQKTEEPQNDNDTAESIVTNLNHAENGTLLQTAIAMVSNLSNTKSDNSVILFDTGS